MTDKTNILKWSIVCATRLSLPLSLSLSLGELEHTNSYQWVLCVTHHCLIRLFDPWQIIERFGWFTLTFLANLPWPKSKMLLLVSNEFHSSPKYFKICNSSWKNPRYRYQSDAIRTAKKWLFYNVLSVYFKCTIRKSIVANRAINQRLSGSGYKHVNSARVHFRPAKSAGIILSRIFSLNSNLKYAVQVRLIWLCSSIVWVPSCGFDWLLERLLVVTRAAS